MQPVSSPASQINLARPEKSVTGFSLENPHGLKAQTKAPEAHAQAKRRQEGVLRPKV